MARITGAIVYRGSFKSIRNYRNRNDKNTYAAEKGGVSREMILTHPAFARTRENISEFSGCDAAVKSLRQGFQAFSPEQFDSRFTGRLVRMIKEINRLDEAGVRGRRDILFSQHRSFLRFLVFNNRVDPSGQVQGFFGCSHSPSRAAATLSVTNLQINPKFVPRGAQYFRVMHHLSVVADYRFSDKIGCYGPVSGPDGMNAAGYSEYAPIDLPLNVELKVAFPAGILITDACTVIQCIGIAFFMSTQKEVYLQLRGGCVRVGDVF